MKLWNDMLFQCPEFTQTKSNFQHYRPVKLNKKTFKMMTLTRKTRGSFELNSTQSLFANNRKYRKTQQYNTKRQVAREA